MNLPASFLPARCCPASLRGSARALALLLALHGAAFVELPLWIGLAFVGGSAHADDGDGGDGDGGGDGGGGGGAVGRMPRNFCRRAAPSVTSTSSTRHLPIRFANREEKVSLKQKGDRIAPVAFCLGERHRP